MILCPLCNRNRLDFRVGKITSADGTNTLGVIGITCTNLGTGMLSQCRYTSGSPLFIQLSYLYSAQVEYEREYNDVREKYDLETQILMGKISTIIFAMREDSLLRAQQQKDGGFVTKNWSLDQTKGEHNEHT